jgi:hypothetical protein
MLSYLIHFAFLSVCAAAAPTSTSSEPAPIPTLDILVAAKLYSQVCIFNKSLGAVV